MKKRAFSRRAIQSDGHNAGSNPRRSLARDSAASACASPSTIITERFSAAIRACTRRLDRVLAGKVKIAHPARARGQPHRTARQPRGDTLPYAPPPHEWWAIIAVEGGYVTFQASAWIIFANLCHIGGSYRPSRSLPSSFHILPDGGSRASARTDERGHGSLARSRKAITRSGVSLPPAATKSRRLPRPITTPPRALPPR